MQFVSRYLSLATYELRSFAEDKILYLRPEQEKDRTHFVDKETGVELELVDSQLLLDWFAQHYKQFGATLEIITDRSQEGSQFVKGFGGIGGLLRYRVDFQQVIFCSLALPPSQTHQLAFFPDERQ